MILKELLTDNKTENLLKELENVKKDLDSSKKIIKEINKRIKKREFSFSDQTIKYIYSYLFACSKVEEYDILNELIDTMDFIELLDRTDIEGSMIVTLTSNCKKPRKTLLKGSKKIKNSIIKGDKLLSVEDILCDLSIPEIKLLREDLDIDNYFIKNGLSFNTLKKETQEKLLADIELFKIYNVKTLREFANSYEDLKLLANNQDFIDLYISKLTDDYRNENKIFLFITEEMLDYILSQNPSNVVLSHLVKDIKGKLESKLFNNETIKELIYNCEDEYILSSIDSKKLVSMILNNPNQNNNLKLINNLPKKDITLIFTEKEEYYNELLKHLNNKSDLNIEMFIKALPAKLFKDLSENQISNLAFNTIIRLLEIDSKAFKKAILKNKDLINKILNNITLKNITDLDILFTSGEFDTDDKVAFIASTKDIQDPKVIIKLVESIPEDSRESLINNQEIRTLLLKNESYKMDKYLIEYLTKDVEALATLSAKSILTVLNNSSLDFALELLSNENILKKVIKSSGSKEFDELLQNRKNSEKLISLLINKNTIKYYQSENLQQVLSLLPIKEKIDLCTNDIIKEILNNDEELIKTYKSLLNKNGYLLNTLDFRILTDSVKSIKISVLENITKYKDIQDYIVRINKHFNILPDFINVLTYNFNDLEFSTTVRDCLSLLCDSCEGTNRKYIGNIPKMLTQNNKGNISKEEYEKAMNYLLYLIPRYYGHEKERITRPIYLETPSSYEEIMDYSNNTDALLTDLIKESSNDKVLEYFVAKHFKMSLAEARIFAHSYSIDKIDSDIYKEEYEFINNLNHILNTEPSSLKEMDKDYMTISMYESFAIENKINHMYGKIYNYEIRSITYSNNSYIKTLYGKEIKVFDCPNDFMFLTSNVDYNDELKKTNSYFEAWHNTLNRQENGLNVSLIANDNLTITEDFAFCFNGVLESGIKKMSKYKLCEKCTNNNSVSYMTPRQLIDNTRDERNTLIIDRYAVRPNYNNSNLPNIEPDFILADKARLEDNSYFEKVSRASSEFKTKRNPNGLPIIAIDYEKIINLELKKINNLLTKYTKSHDMNLITSIITKIENNYTAYRNINKEYAEKFDINPIIDILKKRINETNSVSELNYLEETLETEYSKFSKNNKDLNCNFNIQEIKNLINNKKILLNN